MRPLALKLNFLLIFLMIGFLFSPVAFSDDSNICITTERIPLGVSSVEVKGSQQTVYIKFNNAKSAFANIIITDLLGEEKFYIEEADVTFGEYSIFLSSAKTGTYIVNVSMPDFSYSEKVNLHD